MEKNKEIMRISFFLASIGVAILILLWPIYFFGFSTIQLIEMEFDRLIFFSIIEIILVTILIALWYMHRKIFG
jgi:hypothetical protein